MHDRRALVLDVVDPGLLRSPSPRRDDPELEPERTGAGLDRLASDVGAELRAAEDVDEVDRLLDLRERGDAALPEDLRGPTGRTGMTR